MKNKLLLIGIAALLFTSCTGEDIKGEKGETEGNSAPTVPAEEQKYVMAGDEVTRFSLDLNHIREGQFGFADMTGERLITLDGERPLNRSKSYKLAIGDSGTLLKVKFQYTQQADSEDDGRATMYNFDHMAGHVYAVTEGIAKPNEAYFLTVGEHGVADSLLGVDSTVKGRAADDESVKMMETVKQRAIVKAELVALIGEEWKLSLAEFEKRGNEMLASLVLQAGGEPLFHDIPALYDPNSTWRVDDRGVIRAQDFNVMFAGTSENGSILAVTWLGVEGENSFVLAQENGVLKETEIRAGRYTAPT